MRKLLLASCLLGGILPNMAQTPVQMQLDSIVTKDSYNALLKYEKYTYDENQNLVLSRSYDNSGSYLKMDSVVQKFDSQNQIVFYERKAYPITRNIAGWHPANKYEVEYAQNGKIAKKIASTYNQPSSGATGYYYQASGEINTYDEKDRKTSYIMMSGQYNSEFTEKLKYFYQYDNLDRVVKEETFKKDAAGNWILPDGRKSYTYEGEITKAKEELSEEYTDNAWVNYSKILRSFDSNNQKMTEEAYWKWVTDNWVGSYKTDYLYTAAGGLLHYNYYGWGETDWKKSSYSEYVLDNLERNTSYITYSLNSTSGLFAPSSETQYEYDSWGNQSMTAYYSYSSGVRKGSSKTALTFNDQGQEIEKNTFSWNTTTNNWMNNKNIVTTYQEDGQKVSETEKRFNGVLFDPYSNTTYYYTVATALNEVVTVRPYRIATTHNTLFISGLEGLTQVQIFQLNGALIQSLQGEASIECKIPAGIYLVRINQDVLKVVIP